MSNDPFDEHDEQRIVAEEAAKLLVPLFKAFVSQGLQPQEAAALTAAIMAQNMPLPPIGPMDGS